MTADELLRQLEDCKQPCPEGCCWCCGKCNYNLHVCPGCGRNINHGETQCGHGCTE